MSRWAMRLALPIVLLVATALASYSGFRADHDAADERGTSASLRSTAAVYALTDGLSRRIEDVAGFFVAGGSVTEAEFEAFASPVMSSSQASAIAWAQVVQGKDRAKFERRHDVKITIPAPGGRRVVAPERRRYVVTTYGVRRDNRSGPLGIDIDSNPERHQALVAAASSRTPASTAPVELSKGERGISLYMPVYGVTQNGADGVLGYAVGAFRFDDLAELLTARLAQTPGLELSYNGKSAVSIGERAAGGKVVSNNLDIAGQTWVVRSWVPPGGIALGWIFLVAGLVLTVLVTLLTNLLVRAQSHGRALAEARAREQELLLVVQERKSAAAEERFSQVFDAATIGMALLGPDHRYAKVNAAFCRLVARTESELLGLSPGDITHPDDMATSQASIDAMFNGTQTEGEQDKRYIDANGNVIWAALRTKAMLDPDGKPEMILVQVLDISKRHQEEESLRHMAEHDGLTGLPNRRAFSAALGQQLAVVRRYGPDGALLLLDLDNFKAVNDVHGHSAGDVVLRQVADVIREQLRDSDYAARIGGDEFSIMLPKGNVAAVAIVAERLVKAIAAMGHEHAHDGIAEIACSIGVAMFLPSTSSASAITELADAAMYEAKAAGRNQFVVSAEGMTETFKAPTR